MTPLSVRARSGPRWKLWLALLAVLVALRVGFSMLLGPMVEERLSRVLGTPVDVGDVSFAPLDAILTLRNVTVQAPGAAADGSTVPAITAGRVTIDVQWLPLLHRSFLVRELALESARIDLDRLAATNVDVTQFLRVDPGTELPPGWTFALDRIVLRDSKVKLRGIDEADPAPLEVGVRDAAVSTLRRRASAFGRAPNLRIDAVVDGGRLRIDGTTDLRDDGIQVEALVRVKDMPLVRLQPHLADLGWAGVSGLVSGQLHYQREPGRRDLASGRLEVRRIAVQVPALEEPAFTVRRAVADVDALDLLQRKVTIGNLTLHGARLAVRPDFAAPLPVLDGIPFAPPPAGKQRRPRPAPSAARVAPWSWTIGRLTTPFARLHVAGNEAGGVLGASVSGESLGPGAYWSPLRAWFGRGGSGVVFDGTLRLTHGLVIDGRLTASDVDAVALTRAVGMPFADLAQAGRAAADLTIEVEPAAAKEPPLDVRGHVTLTNLWLAGPAADEFALGASALDLSIAGVDVARSADGALAPARIRISDAVVSAPYAVVTRTADGWLLPPFAAEQSETAGTDAGAASDTVDGEPLAAAVRPIAAPVAASATPASDPTSAAEAAVVPLPRTEAVVGGLRSSGGRLLVVDRTLEPAVTYDVALVEGWAQDVRLPAETLGSFVVQGRDPRFGVVQMAGSGGWGRRDVELSAQAVPLAATSPYLEQAGLPYRFTGGTGSLLSRIAFAGGRWSADTTLTLREPRMLDDDGQVRQSLGMPPEAALAALRDHDGDVTLRVPLSSASAEDPRPTTEVVASAVRDAVARARQTPLPEAPIQIAFAPGRAELSPQAARQLATIADVLSARRDVVVELSGVISNADRRWIAEQELVGDLDEPSGFMGVLRAIGVRDQRERIRDALQERGDGRAGHLDADDEAVVDDLIAQGPPVADERLAGLAAARLTRVASTLTAQHAVAPARVVIADPAGHATTAPPSVRASIGVAAPSPAAVRLEAER